MSSGRGNFDTPQPVNSAYRHDAFISYSRRQKHFAATLERTLESYRPPRDSPVPRTPLDIFLDMADFTAGDYRENVRKHLEGSAKLLLLCSTESRVSPYVNEEIRLFAQLRSAQDIIPILVEGIPNNEARPDQQDQMAFHDALCDLIALPLAVDYRGFDSARGRAGLRAFASAWFMLLASIYGLPPAEVEQREQRRSARRRTWVIAVTGAVVGILIAALAAVLSFWWRAEDQLKVATSRQLAFQSGSYLDKRLDLALLLGIQARLTSDTTEARAALLAALTHSPHLDRFFFADRPSATRTVAISPDNRILAAGGCARYAEDQVNCVEGQIELWDTVSGALLRPPARGHQNQISSLAFSADGSRLLSASAYGGTLISWDVATGKPGPPVQLTEPETLFHTAFDSSGAWLAGGSHSGFVFLLPVRGPHRPFFLVPVFSGRKAAISSLAFSWDRKLLAVGNLEGWIAVLDATAGLRLVWRFRAHQDWVDGLAFSPDSRSLASVSRDGLVKLWTFTEVRPQGREIGRSEQLLFGVTFSPDGKWLAAAGDAGSIRMWDTERFSPRGAAFRGTNSSLTGVAFSADSKRLATAGENGTVVLWNLAGQPLDSLQLGPHRIWAGALAFSRDGSLLASGGCGIIPKLPPELSSLGQFASHTLCKEGEIQLWDVRRGIPVGPPWAGHRGAIDALAFRPDGRSVVSFSYIDRTIIAWDVPARQSVSRYEIPTPESGSPGASVLSPDAETLALGGCAKYRPEDHTKTYCAEGEIHFWNTLTGQRLAIVRGHADGVDHLVFQPNGKSLVSGGGDGTLIIWDLARRKPLRSPLPLKFTDAETGSTQGIGPMAWPSSAKLLAVASGESPALVVLLQPDLARALGTPLQIRGQGVGAISFDPEGTLLATDSDDRDIVLWDVASHSPYYPPLRGHLDLITCLQFSPDGRTLASTSADGGVRLWHLPKETLEDRARRMANRSALPSELTAPQ